LTVGTVTVMLQPMNGTALESVLAVLNGAVGDYLHTTQNGLATEMQLITKATAGTKRVVVLVHGLMCTESVWTMPDGTDYGSLLERDFGFTPIYVRFNSGRKVTESGEELARQLELVVTQNPSLEEILLVGFSMGGLVIRSATHFASSSSDGKSNWLPLVRRTFYIGTPHLGSPWERAGRTLAKILRAIPDPYTRLAADLAELRSAGIKDLGDPLHPLPLLPSIEHNLIAGYMNETLADLFGDGLVPIPSSTRRHPSIDAGPHRIQIFPRLSHLTLAHHPDIYVQIAAWMNSKLDVEVKAAEEREAA
jgi:triacylglycerol lipase